MAKDVKVEIVGDASKYKSALADASKASDKFSKETKSNGDEMTKFGIGALAVGGAIGVGLFKAGEAASNLGESVNAVRVTFGKSADGILKLGEDAATAVGLSNTAFNGLAVQFSSFAQTIAGKGNDVTSTMAEMTGRAADFASVMNIDVAEAAGIFQSGLAGETEPLKKFGIDLSAAAVNAYAAANGIGKMGEQLTESEKVTARYGLLMEQTSKTQGDFANTADSAANATRIAKAEMENAMASLGSVVAPVMATVATKAAALVKAFVSVNEASGGMLVGFTALVGGGAVLLGTVTSVIGRVQKMQAVMHAANGDLTTTGKLFKGMVPVVAIAAVTFFALSQRAKHAADEIAKVGEAAVALSEVSDEDVMGTLVKAFAQGIIAGQSFAETAKVMAEANLEGTKRAYEAAAAQDMHSEATNALRRAILDEQAAVQQAADTTAEFGENTDDAAGAADDAAAATDGLTIAALAADGVLKKASQAANLAANKVDKLAVSITGADLAYQGLIGSLDEDQAWADVNEAIDSYSTKMEEAGDDTAAAAQVTRDLTRDIADYVIETDTIPPQKKTEILALLDQGKLAEAKMVLADVTRNRDIYLNLIARGSGDIIAKLGKLGYSATGGRIPMNEGMTLVGEQGPELISSPGSMVYPAKKTASMLNGNGNGGGGNTYNVTLAMPVIASQADYYRAGQTITAAIAEFERRRGF